MRRGGGCRLCSTFHRRHIDGKDDGAAGLPPMPPMPPMPSMVSVPDHVVPICDRRLEIGLWPGGVIVGRIGNPSYGEFASACRRT
jgi:hypothetical protein